MFDKNAPRRATNVTLNADLVAQAKELGINISQACERGIAEEVAKAHGRAWRQENADALRYANEWVERNGLPLEQFREF